MPISYATTIFMALAAAFLARIIDGSQQIVSKDLHSDDGRGRGLWLPIAALTVGMASYVLRRFASPLVPELSTALDTQILMSASAIASAFALFVAGIEARHGARAEKNAGIIVAIFGPVALGTLATLAWLGTENLGAFVAGSCALSLVMASLSLSSRTPRASGTLGVIASIAAVIVIFGQQFHEQILQPLAMGTIIRLGTAALLILLVFFFKAVMRVIRQDVFAALSASLAAFAAGSTAAALIGVHPALGAFAAGFAMGHTVSPKSLLSERLRGASEGIAAPFVAAAIGIAALSGVLERDFQAAVAAFAVTFAWPFIRAAIAVRKGHDYRSSLRPLLPWPSVAFGAAAVALSMEAIPSGAALGFVAAAFLSGILVRLMAAFEVESKVSNAEPLKSGNTQLRILVALSNPDTLKALLQTAARLREGPGVIVSPLCVISETKAPGGNLDRAETSLAQALAFGSALGTTVVPSIRSALNAEEGLSSALGETGVACAVFGWNKPPRLSGNFGSIVDKVVAETHGFVVIAKSPEQFSAYGSIVLVFPPFLANHPGLNPAMNAIRGFSDTLRARIIVATISGSGDAAQNAARRFVKAGKLVEAATWRELPGKVSDACGPKPAFVILSSRPSGTLWHPALEMLPAEFSEHFPESPMLVAYLPETPIIESPDTPPPESVPKEDLLSEAIREKRICVNMGEASIVDAIRTLLDKALPGDTHIAAKLASTLSTVARERPIEMQEGTVLVHARVDAFDRPIFFFGARPSGWRLQAIESPVHVLIVLCTPLDASPEAHLSALAEIAHAISGSDFSRRILDAKSVEELE